MGFGVRYKTRPDEPFDGRTGAQEQRTSLVVWLPKKPNGVLFGLLRGDGYTRQSHVEESGHKGSLCVEKEARKDPSSPQSEDRSQFSKEICG